MRKLVFALIALLIVASSPLLVRAQSVAVDGSTTFQTIDGFGASDMNQITLPSPATYTSATMDLVFTLNNTQYGSGIGLTLMRTGMCCQTNSFVGQCNNDWRVPQAAVARGVKVWSDPGSPPGIWKDSGTCDGGTLSSGHYTDWANMMKGYVDTAAAHGVTMYALSMQNEPEQNSTTGETDLMGSTDMAAFIDIAGPILHAAYPNLNVLAPETAEWADLGLYLLQIEGDTTANSQTNLYATHQYGNPAPPSPPFSTRKHTWETEYSNLSYFDASIAGGLDTATKIYNALVIGQANAWHYFWVGVYSGGAQQPDGLISFDTNYNPTQIAKKLWTLGNYSRFVRPGYVRIATSGAPSGTLISAYKNPNDGTPVIVVVNNNGSTQLVNLSLANLSIPVSITPYITDGGTNNLTAQSAVAVPGSSFTYTVPAYSVTTFVGGGTVPLPTPAPTPVPTPSGRTLTCPEFPNLRGCTLINP